MRENQNQNRYDLTEGPIVPRMVAFAMPVLLGNIFQQLYNTFDAWCVGNFLGDEALAAVSSSASLIFLVIGFFNGMAMGAGVLVAQRCGAWDYKGLRKAIETDVIVGLVSGAVLTVVSVAMTPTILRWMNTPADVFPESLAYFRTYFVGTFFTVMYNILVGILHAVGDSRHPLYYLMASSVLNVVLDLVFVGAMGKGVAWAALATVISQGVSMVLCWINLTHSDTPYRLHWRTMKVDKESLSSILSFGIPSGVQNSVISIANVVVQTNINAFGKAAMAGCGAYSKIEGFAFLPITCFTQALATFVGQNLGANKLERVKKGSRFGVLCCVVLAESIGVLMYIFAPQLIAVFNNSAEVVQFGVQHMRTICLFNFLLAFTHAIAAILRGAGRVNVSMFTMIVCWCLIRVSYVTVAVRLWPVLTTVSRAYPITWGCSSVVLLIYYISGKWLRTKEAAAPAQEA